MKLPAFLKGIPFLNGALVSERWLEWFQTLGERYPVTICTTSVDRGKHSASSVPPGSKLIVDDWGVTFVARNLDGQQFWAYESGVVRGTLHPTDQKPTNLNTKGDVGLLFYSTDYGHIYRWDGTQFEYSKQHGDDGSSYIIWGVIAPNCGVWHICDGTTGVRKSTRYGVTATVDIPNLVGKFIKGGTSYTGSPVGPTATGATSGGTPAGTNSAPTFTGTTTATSPELGGTLNYQSGGSSANVTAGHAHNHTPVGSVSAPTFTGSPLGTHTHTPGEPEHVVLLPYYRL